jgi:hypothetical protein
MLEGIGAGKEIKRTLIKQIAHGITKAGVQSGWEGITEGLQQIVGNAISKTYNLKQDMMEGVTESALVGAIIGAGTQVTTDSIETIIGKVNKSGSVEKIVQEAISTPEEKRTEEQKMIVDAVFTSEMTPDDALSFVIDNNLGKNPEGQKINLAVLEAKKNNQNLRIIPSKDGKNLEISLVDPSPIPSFKDYMDQLDTASQQTEQPVVGEGRGVTEPKDIATTPEKSVEKPTTKNKNDTTFYRGHRVGTDITTDLNNGRPVFVGLTEKDAKAWAKSRGDQGTTSSVTIPNFKPTTMNAEELIVAMEKTHPEVFNSKKWKKEEVGVQMMDANTDSIAIEIMNRYFGKELQDTINSLGFDGLDTGRGTFLITKKIENSAAPQSSEKIITLKNFSYTEQPGLTPEERTVEKRFGEYIDQNYETIFDTYEKKFGKVINTDNFRELSEDYEKNREKFSRAVHEPASMLAKLQLARALKKPITTKQKTVLVTAGGAGKTTAIQQTPEGKYLWDNSEFIYDTNLNSAPSGIKKIDQMLRSGRRVVIAFVDRNPVEAFQNGVIPRAKSKGRTVPVDTHIQTHIDMQTSIPDLIEHYKGRSDVFFIGVDNKNGKGNAAYVHVDRLLGKVYNKDEIRKGIYEAIDQAYEKGNVTDTAYKAFTGNDPPAGTGPKDGGSNGEIPQQANEKRVASDTSGKPSSMEPIGAGRTKNSRLFERVKDTLGAEYKDKKVTYNELSLNKQADDVVALIES